MPEEPKRPIEQGKTVEASSESVTSDKDLQPTHRKRQKIWFLSAALLFITSAAAGFAGGWFGSRSDTNQTIQKQQVVLKTQGQLISSIAKQVGPSVVSVEATNPGGLTVFGFRAPDEQGAGTGIILDKNGLIITNRHVVPVGAANVTVTLSDGTKFEDVEVLGRTASSDPLDVAFLKIKDLKGKSLSPATLGDSSQANVGDSVVAIGNALGQFQNTVTSGIISGHGRSIVAGDDSGSSREPLQNLFQTDAAINQGNSGGPLVNLDGEVIGINTAIAGGAQNIGFAIPINDVKGMVRSVLTKGKLERAYLGVTYIPITADISEQYKLSVKQGAYIPSADVVGREPVVADSPAAKAGLKAGDVITKIDSEIIDESHSLTSLLGKYQVGDKVRLTYIRDGKQNTVETTLAVAP